MDNAIYHTPKSKTAVCNLPIYHGGLDLSLQNIAILPPIIHYIPIKSRKMRLLSRLQASQLVLGDGDILGAYSLEGI